jgi:hypothetical protein
MKTEYNVMPKKNWGTLPFEMQKVWETKRCDDVVLPMVNHASPAIPVSSLFSDSLSCLSVHFFVVLLFFWLFCSHASCFLSSTFPLRVLGLFNR